MSSEKRKGVSSMSETGMAIVVMMVVGVLGLMKYWRQIVAVLSAAVAAVFLVGVYYIVSMLHP